MTWPRSQRGRLPGTGPSTKRLARRHFAAAALAACSLSAGSLTAGTPTAGAAGDGRWDVPSLRPETGARASASGWREVERDAEAAAAQKRSQATGNFQLALRLEFADRVRRQFAADVAEGRFGEALELPVAEAGRALAETLGGDGKDYVDWQASLALAYARRGRDGDAGRAADCAARALTTADKLSSGRPWPFHAKALCARAAAQEAGGAWGDAERSYQTALGELESTSGRGTDEYADALNALGVFYDVAGQPGDARAAWGRAAELIDRSAAAGGAGLAPGDPSRRALLRATLDNNLAGLAARAGEFGEAEALYGRALAQLDALEKQAGAGALAGMRVACLADWARLGVRQGEPAALARAEARLSAALALERGRPGRLGGIASRLYHTLATLYAVRAARGDEPRLDSTLGDWAAGAAGPRERYAMRELKALGALQGRRYAGAEELLAECVASAEALWGPDGREAARPLLALARAREARGNPAEARACYERALAITRADLELAAAAGSRRQQLRATRMLRACLDASVAFQRRAGELGEATYAGVLAWKGAVYAAGRPAGDGGGPSPGDGPGAAALGITLSAEAGRLRGLEDRGAEDDAADPRARGADVRAARLRVEELRAALARESPAFRARQAAARRTPAEVRRALPKGVVLVDFLEYADDPHDLAPASPQPATLAGDAPATSQTPQARDDAPRPGRRYLAFVVRPDRVAAVDLGPAEDVLGPTRDYRAGGPSRAVAGRQLRERLWDRLAEHLAGARVVLVSPDGELAGLPLAALPVGGAGEYLIERAAVVTVPAPGLLPDLLAEAARREAARRGRHEATGPAEAALAGGPAAPPRPEDAPGALLVGDVDYDAPHAAAVVHGRPVAAGLSAPAGAPPADGTGGSSASPAAYRAGAATRWRPLPASAREIAEAADAYGSTFPLVRVRSLRGSAATEGAFRQEAPGKRYVHLATRAFLAGPGVRSILRPEAALVRELALGPGPGAGDAPAGVDPALLWGLCLAGANRGAAPGEDAPGADDGVLTAADAARVDLAAAEVVVLTGYDPGAGSGSGGLPELQRALQIAGAANVVASAWRADDAATRELLGDFYRRLLTRHEPPALALRGAQLRLLRGREGASGTTAAGGAARSDPSLWGAWTVSGNPGDLGALLAAVSRPEAADAGGPGGAPVVAGPAAAPEAGPEDGGGRVFVAAVAAGLLCAASVAAALLVRRRLAARGREATKEV